jgi:uncharacterized protein YajQ (UPF0234 family)
MPSFDIVSRVDMQEIDNAINNANKEVVTRYDFRGSKTTIELDKKEKKIHVVTDDSRKMEALREIIVSKAIKRGIDVKSLEFKDPTPTTHAALKRDIVIKEGIEQEIAKRVVKAIKESKIKVQASIQGDELRVTGKKIDDLQAVIALVRAGKFELPLQFINMKS